MTTKLTRLGKLLVISVIWFLIGVVLMTPEWVSQAIQTWMTMSYAIRVSVVFFTPALLLMVAVVFAGTAYTFTYDDKERTDLI